MRTGKKLRAGHTFVSNEPMFELRINKKFSREILNIKNGEEVLVSAHAFGHSEQFPLDKFEVIGHNKTIDSVTSE